MSDNYEYVHVEEEPSNTTNDNSQNFNNNNAPKSTSAILADQIAKHPLGAALVIGGLVAAATYISTVSMIADGVHAGNLKTMKYLSKTKVYY